MKLLQIAETAQDAEDKVTLVEAPDVFNSQEDEHDGMAFYGMEIGSEDHKMMVNTAKRLKTTNPKLYQKLINLN